MSNLILLFVLFLPSIIAYRYHPYASTSIGQIKGVHVQKSGKFNVNQFLGVPYAIPPVGLRRFQKPESLPYNPDRIIDATKFAATCVQHPHLQQVISPLLNVDLQHKTSEDCLYLNIYVPVANQTSPHYNSLPVMIWFTGEGFDFADARQFDGTYLASIGQVIVVTVQYRVGVFGFLKDNTIASGNMGLWDQIEALKWVKNNIHAFGGNPNSITVFGRFSGSMSISYLLASPVLRYGTELPLFNKAILMSGVPSGEWSLEYNPIQKSDYFIKSLGCDHNNSSKCLLNLDSELLLRKSYFNWKPTIDSVLIEEEPLKVFSKGLFAKGVDKIIVGSTQSEGSLCLLHWFASKSNYYHKLLSNNITNKEIFQMVKSDIANYPTGKQSEHFQKIVKDMISVEAKKGTRRQSYLDFCSSLLVHSATTRLVSILNEIHNIDVTSYKLKYKPSFSIAPKFIKSASHGEDVLLAFGLINNYPSSGTSKDYTISRWLIKFFSSFAWNGNTFTSGLKDDINLIKFNNKNQKLTINDSNQMALTKHNCSCFYKRNAQTLFDVLTTNEQRSWKPSISSLLS